MKKITMKEYSFVVVGTITAATGILARGQGFVNLDFESANLSGYSPGSVPATDAIPGWTTLTNGLPQQTIAYNAVSALQERGIGKTAAYEARHRKGDLVRGWTTGQTVCWPGRADSYFPAPQQRD